MSTAGKSLRSAIARISRNSALPVLLNSSKMTASPAEPVSTRAEAMMVSEPPPSMLRAAPRNRLGACSAVESMPPESVRPLEGAARLGPGEPCDQSSSTTSGPSRQGAWPVRWRVRPGRCDRPVVCRMWTR
jgi:hypothetical protein